MGIQIESNPDLALRKFGTRGRELSECLPEKLECWRSYQFLKRGQRCYWFGGEIPLLITEGEEKLSRPIASVRIIEATHFCNYSQQEVWTRGEYLVTKVFEPSSPKIHFEAYRRIE